LVAVFGPIVLSQSLLMMAGKPKMLEGGAVRTQLVSRHRLRREALLTEQLAHKLDGCAFVPSALNKNFENLAFMIDRAPQVQPDGVLDEDRGKAMAAVRDIGHAKGYRRLPCPTTSLS
jgi:hypothetical protein